MPSPELLQHLDARRSAVADRIGGAAMLLVPSGAPVPIAGSDLFHEYHAHAEHYYLSGFAVESSVLAYEPGSGWTLFAYQPSAAERVWTGDGESLESLREQSGLDDVRPLDDLHPWIEKRRGSRLALAGNRDIEREPASYRLPGWARYEFAVDDDLSAAVEMAIAESRRTKDDWELEQMRAAATASHFGHLVGMRTARKGVTERALQVEIEAEFFRHGAQRTAYGSIVGSGPHGAVLHFAPGSRAMNDGELLLVDAGAEVNGYASDVTRTYPVGAVYEGLQRDLYQLVLDIQERAIDAVRPGQEYLDLHFRASIEVAAGLVALDILRGSAEDLVEQDAQALFFPHGLGHMLGLATHDAGGCLAGREPGDRPTFRYLRTDLPLQPGYVLTVEPGIYFIDALLNDTANRERYRDAVNWDRVDRLLDFGGIRIEDDVLVTPDGCEVLSRATPKAIADIEAVRREALSA